MRKLVIVLLISACVTSSAFAICGCIDAGTPSSLSSSSRSKFDKQQDEIAKKIDNINNDLKEQVNKTEEQNKKETQKLADLQKAKDLKQRHIAFLLAMQNRLQGTINDVSSIEKDEDGK